MVRAMRAVKDLDQVIWLGNRVSFVFSLQSWLGESPEQKKTASTPAYMSVLMSCSFLSVPLFCLQELISWRGIVMALVVVCISSLQDSDALSLTNHCRPISLSSCLRRLLGVPPAPPHRLRWPPERPNLPNILLHTHHNLPALSSELWWINCSRVIRFWVWIERSPPLAILATMYHYSNRVLPLWS
jgi:hypothetical protein